MRKNPGLFYAAGAYIAWGLLPIYWKALHQFAPLAILAHRIIWALAVLLLFLTLRRRGADLWAALRSRRTVLLFGASALLLSINWLVYIWAVQQGFVVETSLGYFINPLVNVLLGVVFLKERLRVGQGLAVALALAGVLYLTLYYGGLPWIALTLASSFGVYGLIRKTAALGALEGLTLETLLLTPLALGYLAYQGFEGASIIGDAAPTTLALLLFSGVVTSVPLVLFAAGARRITLITLGILQYIAPTLQFALGTLLYGEHLTPERLAGFCMIWGALVIYTIEGGLNSRRLVAGAAPAR